MKTINHKFTNIEELKNFINQNNITNSDNILLQIFTGICEKDFINSLISNIKKELPDIKIIGSTTDGEIIEEKVTEFSTILSFTIFNDTKVEIYHTSECNTSSECANNLIKSIKNIEDARLAILFADGLKTNGELLLNTFNNEVPHMIIAGGMAGDNATFTKTYVFTHNGFIDDLAVCAVFYNPNLIIHTNFSFGWEPIGKEFTVTKAIENTIYSIDDKSPTEIYATYLGEDIADQLPATGIEFPLLIQRGDRKVARAVVGKNKEDGSLIFAGNVNVGDKLWIGYGNIEHILDNSENLYHNINTEAIESIFIYSCMARRKLLGEEIANEMIPLTDIAPVSGFFTYGEFLNDKKTNKLLNETMTVLCLSESQNSTHQKNNIKFKKTSENLHTVKALSHLISQTTQELLVLNTNLEKRVEEEVLKNSKQEQALYHQSKLAQMGEMISMIAHQWRQPLTAISARVNNLLIKIMLDEKIENSILKKELDSIGDYSQHLSTTIDDFRGFFKDDKRKEKTTIKNMVTNTLSIIQTSIDNKNINLIVELEDLEEIETYPNELKQVILNIIKNAEDVLIDNKIINPTITISSYKKDNSQILTIKDNAGGIPSSVMENIFDPYFSTKKEKDGTGLGLYMSKTIIEEHCKGKLSVTNDNDGAVFAIELVTI